jgi:hypothetical protein
LLPRRELVEPLEPGPVDGVEALLRVVDDSGPVLRMSEPKLEPPEL